MFKTRAGRFLVYYIVAYPELEHQTPRQEYARVCADLSAVQDFLDAMAYPNKWRFIDRVLTEAGVLPQREVAAAGVATEPVEPRAPVEP